MTRNERRKAAKARLKAKQERFEARIEAQRLENVRTIVQRNLRSPIERNFYPKTSCIADMAGNSHRAYICRASGGMPRQRALALKAKGSW